MATISRPILVVRWTARALAVILFILWGAFFLEHLQAWFSVPRSQWPPLYVWGAQMAHLALLIGLVLVFKWELGGSLIVLVSALVFFGVAAGQNFLPFFLITALPAFLFIGLWAQSQRLRLSQ